MAAKKTAAKKTTTTTKKKTTKKKTTKKKTTVAKTKPSTTPVDVPADLQAAEAKLHAAAMAFPETTLDFPWGHKAFKVKGKKAFAFLVLDERIVLTVKLPVHQELALELPNVEPTGYGLGKSGWVSATFRTGDDVPVALLTSWLQESFVAVAPKTLVKQWQATSSV